MVKVRSRAGLKKSTFPPVTSRDGTYQRRHDFLKIINSLASGWKPVQYIFGLSLHSVLQTLPTLKNHLVSLRNRARVMCVFIFTKVCSYLEIKWYWVLKLRARMPCLLHSLPSTTFKEVRVTINFVGNFFWRWSPLF